MNNLEKCSEERWSKAQDDELSLWLKGCQDGDDWNTWWKEKFCNYSFLKGKQITSMLEVGCGPYAKNTKMILDILENKNTETVDLLDPLLDRYIKHNLSVKSLMRENTVAYNMPLEKLSVKEKYDLIICINVLDHVYDANQCLQSMYEALKTNGIVIIGQDLTNDDDLKNPVVAKDIMHPIKLDYLFFEGYFEKYKEVVFNKILPREEGRNPPAHYGTLLYSGLKG